MNDAVIDCSIVLKLFIPEEGSDLVVEWSREWRSGNTIAWAPELIIAEYANVMWHKTTKKEISRKIGRECIADFLKLPLNIINHKGLVEAAFRLATENNITVYDALYCVLAYKLKCSFFTADKILARKMKSSSISIRCI